MPSYRTNVMPGTCTDNPSRMCGVSRRSADAESGIFRRLREFHASTSSLGRHMKPWITVLIVAACVTASACRNGPDTRTGSPAPGVGRGSVQGHVRLDGPVPENDAVRVSADPMCSKATGGRRVFDEAVVAAPDGSLGNVFVELVGTFPDMPVPAEPVSIDQDGCVYRPRVAGVRVGQALQV